MRAATLLVVAAVAAVAVASVIASVVGGGESAAEPDTTSDEPAATTSAAPTDEPAPRIPDRARLATELREAGIHGTLFLSDPADDCRVHGIHLPDLGAAPPPKVRSCRFELAPGRAVQSLGDAVWSPDGRLAARESGPGKVEVLAAGGPALYELAGRAPAWRLDGTLTVALGGRVLGFHLPCSPDAKRCASTVLSRRAVEAVRRVAPNLPAGPLVVAQAGWLSRTRLLLVLHRSGSQGIVAVFEHGRLVRPPQVLGHFETLRVSPRGRLAALGTRGDGGRPAVWLVDRGGLLVTTQYGSSEARAMAWSPDGRWTAVATRASVYLMPTDQLELLRGGRQPRTLVLPVAAEDLAWR